MFECRPTACRYVLLLTAAAAGIAAASPVPVSGQARGDQEALAVIDIRADSLPVNAEQFVTQAQRSALARSRDALPQLEVRWNPMTGTPRTVRVRGGFLTSASGQDVVAIVRGYVSANRDLYGLSDADVATLVASRQTDSPGSPGARQAIRRTVTHVALDQEWQGRQVYLATLLGMVTGEGRLLRVSGEVVPNLAEAVNATSPQLTALDALGAAAQTIGASYSREQHPLVREPEGPERRQSFDAGSDFNAEVPVRLIYYPVSRNSVRLVWEVTAGAAGQPFSYQVFVDAVTGDILLRQTITVSEGPFGLRRKLQDTPRWLVYASVLNSPTMDAKDDMRPVRSPAPLSPGPATANGAQGVPVAATMVQTNGDPAASPDGWIPAGTMTTTGNNVVAFVDNNSNNAPDAGEQPTATMVMIGGVNTRTFDFPFDAAQAPTTLANENAATTNAFFMANWFHDRLFDLGFDEAAGNFQDANFSASGVAGDRMEATLHVCVDNSFFATPAADGTCCPRLLACTWSGPNPDRDAALDQEILVHEFTHGLSNRIIGGPNVNGLAGGGQPGGLGEGFSDIYALLLLSNPGEDEDGTYGMGGYALLGLSFNPAGWDDNYYFGIRHFPYSTDLCISSMTLIDMQPATYDLTPIASAGCAGTPPVNPFLTNASGGPHDMGEIWGTALWEVRANLVKDHGWDPGNELALQLITDAMFLLPAGPTFIEARDAVLDADVARTGGANACSIWEGFAKRGFGVGAQTPTMGAFVEDFTPDPVACAAPPSMPIRLALSIHVGVAIPMTMGSTLNPGPTINLDLIVPITAQLGADFRAGYSRLNGAGGGADLDIWNVSGNLKFVPVLSTPWVFVNGGLGFYYVDPNGEAGLNLGVGVGQPLSPNVDIEATWNYHNIFTPTPNLEFGKIQVGLIIAF